MNILFVCTGNTCRSPMAEAILKSKSQGFNVQSAGIQASIGAPVSQGTKEVLQDANMEVAHQAQEVTIELLEWADLVLTMTHDHKQALTNMFASKENKYYTLKEYNLKKEKRILPSYNVAMKKLIEKQNSYIEPDEGFETELAKNMAMLEYVVKEITEVQEIRRELLKEDIQDPFGQSKAVYQATFDELMIEINKLINQERGGE